MIWLNKSKESGPGVITVLDVGSSKTCCIIAKLSPSSGNHSLRSRTHKIKVIGIGYQKSEGVKSGVIIDLKRAEKVIRLCVDSAERMAGLTVDSLIVSLSAGRLKSQICSSSADLGGRQVSFSDMEKLFGDAVAQSFTPERQNIHSLPLAFSLDSLASLRSPCGMVGNILGIDVHILTADAAVQRNLELVINRSHLAVDKVVAAPYASGLSTLVDDEIEMGAACIDIGGGTTSVSIFSKGKLIFVDSIALGGNHVTFDLARGLSIRLEDAERLKVMHASLLPYGLDDREILDLKPVGSQDSESMMKIPRNIVTRIVRARIDEILEILRDRLMRSGYYDVVGKRLILTGGGSQLTGMPEVVHHILGRNARIGRPLGISGLPNTAKGPAFSAVAGLMIYPQIMDHEKEVHNHFNLKMTGTNSRFYRMSEWIRKRF